MGFGNVIYPQLDWLLGTRDEIETRAQRADVLPCASCWAPSRRSDDDRNWPRGFWQWHHNDRNNYLFDLIQASGPISTKLGSGAIGLTLPQVGVERTRA